MPRHLQDKVGKVCFSKGFCFSCFLPVNNNNNNTVTTATLEQRTHWKVILRCQRPATSLSSLHPVEGRCSTGWPCTSAHRLLARESRLSREARILGGELRAECRLRLEEWLLCFFEFVSFWSWLWPGSLLPSFCSWSCSLWEGNVFLIVLIRNLLFVPARGQFSLWRTRWRNKPA